MAQFQLQPDHLNSFTLGDAVRRSLSVTGVYRESVAVLLSAPLTFALITLSLIFPHSLTVLFFSHRIPLLHGFTATGEATQLFYDFLSLLFLFTFSLLSTAAVVYTVASLYASEARPVSFTSTLSALPSILPQLFLPFLFTFVTFVVPLDAIATLVTNSPDFFIPSALLLPFILAFHLFVFALSYLANSVAVLERLNGRAIVIRSIYLMRCRTSMSATVVTAYLICFHSIDFAFKKFVVKGFDVSAVDMILLGGTLLTLLPVVILHGLIVQTVHYYVCKSSIQMDTLVEGVHLVHPLDA